MTRVLVCTFLNVLLLLCSLPLRADVVVPDRVVLTVRKSPVLYFFMSEATSLPVRFTLRDERSTSSLAEIFLPPPPRAGFWAIRLKDYDIQLAEDIQYRWYVSIIRDSTQNLQDIVSQGVIERIDPQLVDYYDQVCDRDSVLLALKADLSTDGYSYPLALLEAHRHGLRLPRV